MISLVVACDQLRRIIVYRMISLVIACVFEFRRAPITLKHWRFISCLHKYIWMNHNNSQQLDLITFFVLCCLPCLCFDLVDSDNSVCESLICFLLTDLQSPLILVMILLLFLFDMVLLLIWHGLTWFKRYLIRYYFSHTVSSHSLYDDSSYILIISTFGTRIYDFRKY